MGNIGSITTAKGELFTNAHVLSQSRAGLGYFVISGCDINQSGTPGMSVVLDSGSVQCGWGTTQKTVTGGTVVITASHPSLPRMDVIYIDVNGAVHVYDGTPTAISPGDKTDFKQMATPAPGSNIPNGVILALVYVAAGDTAITNAEILDIATYGTMFAEAPSSTTSGKVPYWSSTPKTFSDGYTVGTTANCLLQLDSSARIPAVSGALLTSISHANLSNLTSGNDHTQYVSHSLASAANDFIVASDVGIYVTKTLAQVKSILGLGTAAYTASTDYAVAAKGVTNGDSHDHSGGDGASIPTGSTTFAATSRILGRKTASGGAGEECTLSEILDFIGSAARGDLLIRGASGWIRREKGTTGQVLMQGADEAAWTTREYTMQYVFGDGSLGITANSKTGFEVPITGRIVAARIISTDGTTGSIELDLWQDQYADGIPTIADTIDVFSISSGTQSQETGLNLAITKGDWLTVNVKTVTSMKAVTLSLSIEAP